jgi:hypothetical protein
MDVVRESSTGGGRYAEAVELASLSELRKVKQRMTNDHAVGLRGGDEGRQNDDWQTRVGARRG